MREAFYQLNYTTWRKVQDSNLWRFYPQRLAIFCITTLPTFLKSLSGIGMVGFEPTISRLSAVCIRPLCYIPMSGNTRNRTETSCSSDIRADQPTPCSHTMQSMYDRLLSDACKIGWSFTSILQIGKFGFEPKLFLLPKQVP